VIEMPGFVQMAAICNRSFSFLLMDSLTGCILGLPGER
jgi:hypothetical protein